MKLVLTCPNCGKSEWLEETDEDGAFVCAACGEHAFTENMSAGAVELEDAE